MTESWTRLRAAALDSLATLTDLLGDPATDDRRLVSGYLETKMLLAAAFEALAGEKYTDPTVLDSAKTVVESAMRSLYPDLPVKYLRVRGFGTVHARLLAYLARRVMSDVSAGELRMLTGDAVHTERRTRELRDLGFQLDARHTSGSDVYVLRSNEPDPVAGAATLVAKNIREDRSISKTEALAILRAARLS